MHQAALKSLQIKKIEKKAAAPELSKIKNLKLKVKQIRRREILKNRR